MPTGVSAGSDVWKLRPATMAGCLALLLASACGGAQRGTARDLRQELHETFARYRVLFRESRYPGALAVAERSVAILDELAATPSEQATAYLNLGFLLKELGAYNEARTSFDQAESALANSEDVALKANLAHARTALYFETGDYAEAAEQAARLRTLVTTWRRGMFEQRASAMQAHALAKLGRHEEARVLLEAVVTKSRDGGEGTLPLYEALHFSARVWTDAGRPEEGLRISEEALTVFRAGAKDHPPETYASLLHTHGLALLKGKQHQQAALVLSDEVDLLKGGPASPRVVATARYRLAQALQGREQYTQALEEFNKAIAILEKHFRPSHRSLAMARFHRAKTLWAIKRKEQALAEASAALDTLKDNLSDQHENVQEVHLWLSERARGR